MNDTMRCGRLGKHLSHYWRGSRIWQEDRWIKPVYFCTGHVQIEGGHRGVH